MCTRGTVIHSLPHRETHLIYLKRLTSGFLPCFYSFLCPLSYLIYIIYFDWLVAEGLESLPSSHSSSSLWESIWLSLSVAISSHVPQNYPLNLPHSTLKPWKMPSIIFFCSWSNDKRHENLTREEWEGGCWETQVISLFQLTFLN